MKKVDAVALLFLVFGGINWGLWGLFEFNLVYYIFGTDWIDRVVYVLLGISAIYVAIIWKDFNVRWNVRNSGKSRK